MPLLRPIRVFLRSVGDLVYPPACPLCRTPLIPTESAFRFCDDCLDELRPPESAECGRCAAPVGPHLGDQDRCLHCRTDRFRFDRVARLGIYDGRLRSVCLKMKQADSGALIRASVELMWAKVETQLADFATDVVMSVPQHWRDRVRSRHNSSEQLGRQLAGKLKLTFRTGLLRKTRKTPRQSSLTPTDRRSNLRKAFAAKLPKRFQDRAFLLVDDVLTTGSTAHECSRALLDAGAKRVDVAVIARGLGRDVEQKF